MYKKNVRVKPFLNAANTHFIASSYNVWVQLDLPFALDLDCSLDFTYGSSRYSKCNNNAVIQVKDALHLYVHMPALSLPWQPQP